MVSCLISQRAFKKPWSLRSRASGWLGKFNGSGDYSSLSSWKEVEKERGRVDQSALNSVLLAATVASDT